MKVWIATSGEYSDYRIRHVFARREDAEAYQGADDVAEYEVREGPVEMRPWYVLAWNPGIPDREGSSLALANPYESARPEDYDSRKPDAVHHWTGPPGSSRLVLHVEGWDLRRVRKVYSEQRARYLAPKAGIS